MGEPDPSMRPRPVRPPKSDICVYCLKRPATTRDHVFARAFFASPLPANMLTVPTCVECNKGKGDGIDRDMSLDEEYVRNTLCIWEGGQKHPIGIKVFHEKANGSFERSHGLQADFLSRSHFPVVQNEQGIVYQGDRLAFRLDRPRISRVLRKITKGLHFHHTGIALVADTQFTIKPWLKREEMQALNDNFQDIPIGFGAFQENAVSYIGTALPKQNFSTWLVIIYGFFGALLVAEPKGGVLLPPTV